MKERIYKVLECIALLALSTVFLLPFIWMISTAIKPDNQVMTFPPVLIPKGATLKAFAKAWSRAKFPTYFGNTLFITVTVAILQVLIMIPAAYAFSQKKFKGSSIFFGMVLAGLMIPPQVTFLPLYIFFSNLKLIDSPVPLIAPWAVSSFGIFLLTQNFKQIPKDIIESARLDMASDLKIMFMIMLPIAKPAMITFILFSFITRWNDYFWVLTMTNSDIWRTLSIGVVGLMKEEGSKAWNIIMAGNVMLIAPILVIYALASKRIKSAFTYMGIK